MEEPIIIDRGCGPEIRGTRITVYTILDYYLGKEVPHLRSQQMPEEGEESCPSSV